MSDIYKLLDEAVKFPGVSPEYAEKQLHPIPQTEVVDRAKYLIKAATEKVVFDFGATGPMAELLQKAAKAYHGTDIMPNDAIENFYRIDLDKTDKLPPIPGLELIIAGEVIEHLSNAGHFLELLHRCGVPVILTTPNAFSRAGIGWLAKAVENVNREHVAWYSWYTLKTLVERHRFNIVEWFWYNGHPLTAEGLIFKMEPVNGTT